MPNTHPQTHIFLRRGKTEAFKKPCVSSPSVTWSNNLLLWVYVFLKGQRMNKAFCTTAVLHKSRDEHLRPWSLFPHPSFAAMTRQIPGLYTTEKQWLLRELEPGHISDSKSKSGLRERVEWRPACLVPTHPSQAFSRSIGHVDRSTMRGLFHSSHFRNTPQNLFEVLKKYSTHGWAPQCADTQNMSDPR